MKKQHYLIFLSGLLLLNSCSAIEGIFKAGYYSGIFVVIVILAIALFLFSKFRKR